MANECRALFVAKVEEQARASVHVRRSLHAHCDAPGEVESRCRRRILSAAQKKAPGSAPGALVSSRNRSYLLTAILACRSVGRTIGNGGLVTTSLTQRASPPLK